MRVEDILRMARDAETTMADAFIVACVEAKPDIILSARDRERYISEVSRDRHVIHA